jgi:hypothetical protein
VALTGCDDVSVLNEDTLGCSCGPRCVHDAGDVLGLGRDWVGGVCLAILHQFVKTDDLQVRVCACEFVDVLLLGLVLGTVDHDLHVFGFLEGIHELGEQVGVCEHDLCLGLQHRVLEPLFP